MLLDNICQSYHWTLSEAMSLTMPQILMLGHASSVNFKRMQEKVDRDRKAAEEARKAAEELESRDPMTHLGKRMSELTTDEMLQVVLSKAE